jgi:hypothetical protein
MKITLHRTGDFLVNDKAEDSTQCGFTRGSRQVFFDVSIESDTEMLDGNGFVLDNNEVQHYFEREYAHVTVFQSCERIALKAIDDLRALMGNDRTFYISCEIKPGSYAGLKCEKRFMCHIDSALHS